MDDMRIIIILFTGQNFSVSAFLTIVVELQRPSNTNTFIALDDSASINIIKRLTVPLSLMCIGTFLHRIVCMLCTDGPPQSLQCLTTDICSLLFVRARYKASPSEVILSTKMLASSSLLIMCCAALITMSPLI